MQQTSLLAFKEVLETLGNRQKTVIQVFEQEKSRHDITNAELSSLLGWEINRVTPRTNELVKKGVLRESQKRKCTRTGRTAIAWQLTPSGKLF